jgi:hypothetical protein
MPVGGADGTQQGLHQLQVQRCDQEVDIGDRRHALPPEQTLPTAARRFCASDKKPPEYCGKQSFMRSMPAT